MVNQKGLPPILIVIILAAVVLFAPLPGYQKAMCNEMYPPTCYPAGWRLGPSLWDELTGKTTQTVQQPIRSPSPNPDPTTNWKTYTNTKYNFQFSYPPGWRIIYDKQPDPSGNPTKYSVVIEKDSSSSLIVTMLRSDQYQTFESLSNILNLPSESATITNRKEIVVDGRKALYVIQNNSKEGIITLDPENNLIILEVNSKVKTIFDQILSTFKFLP